jgi:hypothetical protein
MRNRFLSRLAVFAGALLAFSSGVFGSSIAERFSLRVSPMAMVTLGGHFNDTDKLSAVVDIGGGLGAGVRFELSKNAYLDAGYSYLVLPVKTGKTPYAFRHQNSYFDMSAATLNLSLYLKSGYVIEPYLTLGCGLYPWSFRHAGGKRLAGLFKTPEQPLRQELRHQLRPGRRGQYFSPSHGRARIPIHLYLFPECGKVRDR